MNSDLMTRRRSGLGNGLRWSTSRLPFLFVMIALWGCLAVRASSSELDLNDSEYNHSMTITLDNSTVAGGTEPKKGVTIGFLSSWQDGMGKLIAGAIPLAVEEVNRDPTLLPNRTLYFIAGDAGNPDSPIAIKKMTDMREQGAVAFVGLDHSCESEAKVAAAWNNPMITYKCADGKVSNKEIYSTFARTLPASSKVSKSVIALLKHYKWHKIVLVVSDNPSDKQVEEALVALAKNNSIQITSKFNIPGDYLTKWNETLKSIIKATEHSTRIYVLLADTHTLVDFAGHMQDLGLIEDGDRVIISVEKDEVYDPNRRAQYCRRAFDAYKQYNSKPCRSLLILAPSAPINPNYTEFQRLVSKRNEEAPFFIPTHPYIKPQIPIYAGLAYDAVMVYARALTRVLAKGGSERNGTMIVEEMKFMRYLSILGFSLMIDEKGDAEGNYTLLALQDNPLVFENQSQTMQPVGRFTYQSNEGLPLLTLGNQINWIKGHPPADEPRCGFKGEHCVYKPDWKVITFITICCCIMTIASIFVFRHYRYEQKLACLLWKVDVKDVVLLRTNSEYTLQNLRNTINFQGIDATRFTAFTASNAVNNVNKAEHCLGYESENGAQHGAHNSSGVAFFKGNVVFMKRVYKKSIDLTRSIRKELIQIREMRHENINPFIGASVDAPNVCILSLYCARGSLEDVLKNEDLDLDNMFIASLVADLIKGMIYLHDSEIVSHGNLKSSNCLVDSRWVLQITDYGLHEYKAGQDFPPHIEQKCQKDLLWRAPELLRLINPPSRGTQKADVYSFAIILYEMIGRKGPWGQTILPSKCIIDRLVNPANYDNRVYRPPTQDLKCPGYVLRCMEESWHEDPDARPDFRFINIRLREMQTGLKPNIFDNMIAIMEKYAYNLEGLVQERTNQLMEEKKKTENLLLRMLPKPVAEQLKLREQVEAEIFENVTIYFSDIVGFTTLSASSTPLQVVDLLNDLYTCFDSIIGNYDVYKVETIGDAYMVVSGLPLRNGNKHAGQIASMALHLLSAIQNFEIRHKPGERLKLRIGIHSGPCVAGVVGLKMPRYCLFGDTVNTSSRMESTGEALKIHVSETCKTILDKLGGYVLRERGLTPIKGKGVMHTYWLVGKTSASANLMPPDQSKPQFKAQAVLKTISPPVNGMVSTKAIVSLFSPQRKKKISDAIPGLIVTVSNSKPSHDFNGNRGKLNGFPKNGQVCLPREGQVCLPMEVTHNFVAPSISPNPSDSEQDFNEETTLQEHVQGKAISKPSVNGYCLTLFNECKRNLFKELNRSTTKRAKVENTSTQLTTLNTHSTATDCFL